jgi:hypothetical protein
MKRNEQRIKAKAELNLPLSERERARYLLFIANSEQAKKFIDNEKITGVNIK